MAGMSHRYPANALITFATDLLMRAGLEAEKAATVGAVLVEGDLLGHTTHGLALLPQYLAELENGTMTKAGDPLTVAELPVCVTWDGRRLPGPWLVAKALDLAVARARLHGTCTVVIRRSHHIACLAAYLTRATEQGMMVMLTCSDPSVCSVAPFGGRKEVFTPNPLAAAWPTDGEPVIFDVSMSITTNGMTKRLHGEGRRFSGLWALDASGKPTNDPAALFSQPPGTLLPIGGLDHGHKGYVLALWVEALTGGLVGHGRADPNEGWGASVFLQVINPAAFGGSEEFRRQTTHVATACRATPPRAGFEHVRLPGENGLRRRAEQLANGVELYPAVLPALRPWVEKLAANYPSEISPDASR